jgi:hypothetical protein
MKIKHNEISKKDPQLYIKGEKIKFYSSREERLAKIPYKKIKDNVSIFNKKNRSILIMAIDLALLLILIVIFLKPFNKKNEEFFNSGFRYYFTQKIEAKTKNISFTFEIKNISLNDNNLAQPDFKLQIINKHDQTVYSKNFTVSKIFYKPNEYYQENMIIDKLEKGKYQAVIYLGSDLLKKIKMPLIIK